MELSCPIVCPCAVRAKVFASAKLQGSAACFPESAALCCGSECCLKAKYNIAPKGNHQIRSFVRIIQPQLHGRAPWMTDCKKPIGPKILPRNPTAITGQCLAKSRDAHQYPNP